jgi:hypothetical protein
MTDGFIRHLVSFLAMLLALLIYAAAYISGSHGWWWTSFGLIFIYVITYKIVHAAGGH